MTHTPAVARIETLDRNFATAQEVQRLQRKRGRMRRKFKVMAVSSSYHYGIPVWLITTARSHVEALEDLEMLAIVRGYELFGDVVLV